MARAVKPYPIHRHKPWQEELETWLAAGLKAKGEGPKDTPIVTFDKKLAKFYRATLVELIKKAKTWPALCGLGVYAFDFAQLNKIGYTWNMAGVQSAIHFKAKKLGLPKDENEFGHFQCVMGRFFGQKYEAYAAGLIIEMSKSWADLGWLMKIDFTADKGFRHALAKKVQTFGYPKSAEIKDSQAVLQKFGADAYKKVVHTKRETVTRGFWLWKKEEVKEVPVEREVSKTKEELVRELAA